MVRDSGVELRTLKVDGGAVGNDLLMQMQADLGQTPVARPRCRESTALGAACLAGLEVEIWENEEELGELLETERTFEPATEPDEVEPRWQQWRRAVERSRDWSAL